MFGLAVSAASTDASGTKQRKSNRVLLIIMFGVDPWFMEGSLWTGNERCNSFSYPLIFLPKARLFVFRVLGLLAKVDLSVSFREQLGELRIQSSPRTFADCNTPVGSAKLKCTSSRLWPLLV